MKMGLWLNYVMLRFIVACFSMIRNVFSYLFESIKNGGFVCLDTKANEVKKAETEDGQSLTATEPKI